MKVRVGTSVYRGRAVDLRAVSLAPETVYEAVCAEAASGRVAVDCPTPRVGHEALWHVDDPSGESLVRSLEAAARSRGMTVPEDTERASVETTLSELDVPDVETAEARRRVADVGDDETRLRERVAALRGKIQERREAERDTTEVGRTLTGASKTEFALAAYVETHEPVEELADATSGELTPATNATVAKRDALAETMSDASEFF
ncbi:hypothetical protein [Haloprofundus halobius]|uniref:DUF7858 family protein n=1 Tax=Haloprofundus halobius TaxID=2876194 RepID=UPI001CCB433D|nr:hypothetical protein [Haloprofundus halobius]